MLTTTVILVLIPIAHRALTFRAWLWLPCVTCEAGAWTTPALGQSLSTDMELANGPAGW